MIITVWVAVLGVIGVLCRYAITSAHPTQLVFPVGTFIANVTGCFLIGIIYSWLASHGRVSDQWTIGVTVGLLGGLTTFSGFAIETLALMERGLFTTAALNWALTNFCGIGSAWLGLRVGRYIELFW